MDKNIIYVRNMLSNANDFKYIAFRLTDTGKNKIGNKFYGTQFFVNGSFSVELYLKALLLFDGIKVPATHNLKSLYNHLSKVRKKELKRLCPKMISYLNEQKDFFIKWRYRHEYGCLVGSITDMKDVLNILETYCNNIIRELEDYD